jgi:hypothetical protein
MSRPVVRNEVNGAWIDVFCRGGWKMKTLMGDYITLSAANTKMRNAENTGWVEFYCPIAPPKVVVGGKIRANRLVDTSGFLWAAGYGPGIYEDGTNFSKTWQKVKHAAGTKDYINNIKFMDAGDNSSAPWPPMLVITNDNKIWGSGNYRFGQWGTGINGSSTSIREDYYVDHTTMTEYFIDGKISDIAQLEADGILIKKDGTPYAVGLCAEQYQAPNNTFSSRKEFGLLGAGIVNHNWPAGATYYGLNASWSRVLYSSDRKSSNPLSGIVSMAKNANRQLFALRDDGKLFQCPYWHASGTKYTYPPSGILPNPQGRYDSMFEIGVPFTETTPVYLHSGAILEGANGNLYYARKKMHFEGDRFFDFEWVNTGINVKSFDSKVVRVCGYVDAPYDNYEPQTLAVFILLEDGRLYASGSNDTGWFGIGSTTKKVPLNAPVLSNRNVADFDIDSQGCILMKKDGKMWACGNNQYARLGLGEALANTTMIYDWNPCVFTSL